MEKSIFMEELFRQQSIHRISSRLGILFLLLAGLILIFGFRIRRAKKGVLSAVLLITLLVAGAQPALANRPGEMPTKKPILEEDPEEIQNDQPAYSAVFRVVRENFTQTGEEDGPVHVFLQWKNLAQKLPEYGEETLHIEYKAGNQAESLELDLGYGTPVTDQLQSLEVDWISIVEEKGSSEQEDGKNLDFLVKGQGEYCFSAGKESCDFFIGQQQENPNEDKEENKEEDKKEDHKPHKDALPPEISVSLSEAPAGGSLYSASDQISLQIHVLDKGEERISGIKRITCLLKNADSGWEETHLLFMEETGNDGKKDGLKEWRGSFSPDGNICRNGILELTVQAEDQEGNTATGKKLSAEIDGKAPVVILDAPLFKTASGQQFASGKSLKLQVKDPHFDTACQPEVVTRVRDGYSFSGWQSTDEGAEGILHIQKDGEYEVKLQAVDLAGNRAEKVSSGAFILDRTSPRIRIQGVQDSWAYRSPVTPVIQISDASFSLNDLQFSLKGAKSGPLDVELLADTVRTENGISIAMNRFPADKDDVYTLSVRAADYAGNAASEEVVFSMDQSGSSYILSDATKELVDRYYTREPEELVLSEINVCEVNYEVSVSKDGEPKVLQEGRDYSVETRGGDGDWLIYIYRIFASNFEKEGVYHVEVISRDKASNVNNSQVRGARIDFAVDRTPPMVTVGNLEDGAWYKEKTHPFTVRGVDRTQLARLQVLVNGQVVCESEKPDEKLSVTLDESDKEQLIQIRAEDKAGNQVVLEDYRVTVQRKAGLVSKEVKEKQKEKKQEKEKQQDMRENPGDSDDTEVSEAAQEKSGSWIPVILAVLLLPFLIAGSIFVQKGRKSGKS